jgi:hypothetical protein
MPDSAEAYAGRIQAIAPDLPDLFDAHRLPVYNNCIIRNFFEMQ